MKCTALIGCEAPAACDVPSSDWLWPAGCFSRRDSGLPGSGLVEEGGKLGVAPD